MIVEHDPDILHILTHIFQEQVPSSFFRYNVQAFSSEYGVLERIKFERPDAVLLDIIKPTFESTVLCRGIRENEEIKDTPIIALYTHVQAEKIHSICADKVLGKPFEISDLISAVEGQLIAHS